MALDGVKTFVSPCRGKPHKIGAISTVVAKRKLM